MGKSTQEAMQETYGAEWRLDAEDVSHIHAGYWHPETPLQDIHIAYENYMREITKHLPILKDQFILDVGCGNGAAAIWMAQHYDCRICGIDIVPLHVDIARKAIKRRGLEDKIEIHLIDAQEIDFPDATFDHAYSLECFHHLDGKKDAFRKIQQGLKSDGYFALAEQVLHENCSWLSGKLAGLITGSHSMAYIEDYPALLAESGFELVAAEDVTEFTLRQMYRWSKNENHRQIVEYSKKIYGRQAAITIPLCFFLASRVANKSHWGLHFMWSKKR